MKIVIAPDSLKESLSSPDAAAAIARGCRRAAPTAALVEVPLADGGEGTVRALAEATGGEIVRTTVRDPLGRPVTAGWALCGDGRTAVVEMAASSGLELLAPAERDPMRTSTFGTGQLIAAALGAGAFRVIVGVGGSATVDGGTGMAEALGVRFLDAAGKVVQGCCGGNLQDIAAVDATSLDPRVAAAGVTVAADVTNPLLGEQGAARVYGPQKGATPEQVEELEAGLASLAEVVQRDLGIDVAELPGSGAAGGLGAGLVAFLGAEIRSGVATVMEAVGLAEMLADADLVLTAEGRCDGQSAFGKTVAGVAGMARERGVPAVVLAGSLGPGYEGLRDKGIAAAFAIADGPQELAAALARSAELLERTAEEVVRLWVAARGL